MIYDVCMIFMVAMCWSEYSQSFTGWWETNPSEKYEFVKWDDEIPKINGTIKSVPNHQPDSLSYHTYHTVHTY